MKRESLWDLFGKNPKGNVIADKGLIGTDYQKELRQLAHINLQTAVRANMKETRSDSMIKWLISTRRLVETVIGQLTERFHIEKVQARKTMVFNESHCQKSFWHTTDRDVY